jgi:beta-1,4-N-acetylglucosaminyltransferase
MKIALICSQGGHLTEMLELLGAFEGHEVVLTTYDGPRNRELAALGTVYSIPYRGVGPLAAMRYGLWALRVMLRERPALVVSTGAEIAIPFFVFGKLMRTRLVFVESLASVERMTKTGRLMYPLSDLFLVQWPQLLAVAGSRARYGGTIL